MAYYTDFSRFDRVLSSIIVLSPTLEVLYANPMAKRQHPVFSAKNCITTRFNGKMCQRISQALISGNPVRIPWAEFDGIFLLFEPVFDSFGRMKYAYLQVETPVAEFDSLLPILTDGELLSLLEREVATPLNQFYSNLNFLEKHSAVRNNPSFLKQLLSLKRRVLQVCEFLERARYAYPSEEGACSVCNADKLLCACAEQFRFFKYHSVGPTHVPMEESAMSLILCDILSNLYLRQGDNPRVEGELVSDEEGTSLVFSSEELKIPLDVPCNGDRDGIDIGLFSVKSRITHAGGSVTVEKSPRGSLMITVKLPKVRFSDVRASVSAPRESMDYVQWLTLEYLSLLTAHREPEE